MKKIIVLAMSVLLLVFMTSCGDNSGTTTEKNVSFSVITPAGSPALAQTYFEHQKPSLGANVSYDIEVVSDATKLSAAFASLSHEFIYAPINMGVKMFNATGNYQLAASIVHGNNYIVTATDEEFTISSLNDKDLIFFGQGNVPSIVANTILEYNNVTPKSIDYVAATSDSMNQMVLDSSKIVLIAEPSLSALKVKLAQNSVTNLKVINLQEEWKKMTGDDSYVQAAIFVKKSFAEENHDVVVNYLNEISKSVSYTNENVDEVAQMAVELEYSFPLPVLKTAIPSSNLLYQSALESKTAVNYLLNIIIDSEFGTLIGNTIPGDDFYFA